MDNLKCDMCGKCCSYEIPITILDISRVAKGLELSCKEVFDKYIEREVSENSGIFKIKKKENAECVFLKNNKCSIHDFEPNICKFYFCQIPNKKESGMWVQQYSNNENDISGIWEQSVAIAVTKAYIKANNTVWNESDFNNYLNSITNNIKNKETQKIKLTSNSEGNPICVIYDCKQCDKAGELATETIVTIADIRKIVSYLNITWSLFFSSYIDPENTKNNLLKLKRKVHCVFHLDNGDCLIDNVKPNHCLFTTCPIKCTDNDNYDRFYLGSGTIDEQYQHQVALNYTKEYVAKFGSKYNKTEIDNMLSIIDKTIKDKINYTEFCNQISQYRYIK